MFLSIVPVIIKEIVPLELSGSFGSFTETFVALGTIIGMLMQYIILSAIGDYSGQKEGFWRILFGIPIITLLIQLIAVALIYKIETPKYLLGEGQIEECKKLL